MIGLALVVLGIASIASGAFGIRRVLLAMLVALAGFSLIFVGELTLIVSVFR